MKSFQMLKIFLLTVFLLFMNSCASNKTSVVPSKSDTPAEVAKVSAIQKITFSEESTYTRIYMEGSETINTPFYKLLSDPLRIVIDIPKIDLKQIKEPVKINNGTIGEVLTTQFDDKGRIEIILSQMANYNISKEDKSLIIDIEKVKKVAEVKEVKEEKAVKVEKVEDPVKEKVIEKPSIESKKEEPSPPTPVVTPPVQEVSRPAKEVLNVLFENKNDYITFDIIGDGKFGNYNAYKLDSPPRLVLDIWEVSLRNPKQSINNKNPFIKRVRTGHQSNKLRFVFDSLNPKLPPYQINRINNKLIVSIGNVPQPSEPQILVKESPTIIAKSQPKTPPVSEGTTKKTKAGTLTEINFKQMDGKSRITITLTEEPQFESHTITKNIIAVDIKNVSVPKRLLRGLDTSEFESAVNTIDLKNVKTGKMTDVRILIKLKEEVPFETTKEGKTLFIDIEKPKKIEAKIEAPPEIKKEEAPIETKKEEVKKEEKPVSPPEVTKKIEEEKKAPAEGVAGKVYTGSKLSFDFKDADVKNILRLIAEVSDLNIITGDDVRGTVTMRLVDVPWDQALDLILQAKSLGMIRVGNVIRIAPLDALKKEVQAELEAKRGKEKLEDLKIGLIPVNYATAKEIMPQIQGILSERGVIKVDERTNTLIVKDIVSKIAEAKSLVKDLDTKTPQVLIEARIVEANLTFQKELGVKWGFEIGSGKASAGGGNPGTTLGTATREIVDLPITPRGGVAGSTPTAGLIEFLFSRGTIKSLDLAISAHENKGDVKIISSPKIATLNNKQASIVQGLKIPYRKLTTEGTITTDFIDANLKLIVTPIVTNDGNIKMTITTVKDAPDQSIVVDGVPSIDKKEANTEVLVKDNGVVVIAGVYSIEKSEGDEGIPLFKKIPLLGWLFKREAKEDKRKDLLIFISPKIITDQTL